MMNALVKKFPQKGLWLEKADIPSIKDGEALVRVRKTAICGTDLHIYNWDAWSQRNIKTPMIIGHEFVGEIVEIKGKSEFKTGDLVSAEGHIVCGHCKPCLKGERHLCPNTRGIGVNIAGIFAEYAAIPVSNLWKCQKGIKEELYSIFDPFGNAVHTALSYSLVGENVLITGAGPIGIMAAAVCVHAGARKVVLTNTSDFRLGLAKEVSSKIITINTKTESMDELRERHGIKEGFDVALEMSGSGEAFNMIVRNMINGGKIALLGLINGNFSVDWDRIIFGCMKLKGIYGREMFDTWHKMTALIEGGLNIEKVITHRMHYTEFEKGFELMNSKKCGKVILEWN